MWTIDHQIGISNLEIQNRCLKLTSIRWLKKPVRSINRFCFLIVQRLPLRHYKHAPILHLPCLIRLWTSICTKWQHSGINLNCYIVGTSLLMTLLVVIVNLRRRRPRFTRFRTLVAKKHDNDIENNNMLSIVHTLLNNSILV